MNEEEILKFLEEKKSKTNKKVFDNWKDEILLLRKNGATLDLIMEFIFTKDKELQSKYENRLDTARSLLSKFIRRNQKLRPTKEQKPQRSKNEERINIKEEEPRAETIKEDVKTPSPVNEEIVAEKEDIFKLKPINKNDGLKVADKTNYK